MLTIGIDAPPTLETVDEALQALYRNPDTRGKEKASIWLGELQKSVFAWQVADQLLSKNLNVEACYFAAQTMRTKIQYAFHELPEQSHQSLRDSLLAHVARIAPGTPPEIVTQLCLSVADLALQMISWKSPVLDFIDKFSKEHMGFLLELLTLLPEEIQSRSLRLAVKRQNQVIEELTVVSPRVLQLLVFVNTTSTGDESRDHRARSRTFKVLASWLAVKAVPQNILLSTQVLSYPFQILTSLQSPAFLHEAATECVCSALSCAQDVENYRELADKLFQSVNALVPCFHLAEKDSTTERCVNFCRIFTEMSESFFEMILNRSKHSVETLHLLDLLLMCVNHPQSEVGEITFNFWHRLSEELFHRDDPEVTSQFKPYVQNLVLGLCWHCRLEQDFEGLPDESRDVSEFRIRASELIKDLVFVAGSSSCLVQMFELLKSYTPTTWYVAEAALFVMIALAKSLVPEETVTVPHIIGAILTMSASTHVAVRYTSIQLVSELTDWINNNVQFLDSILHFLLDQMQEPKLSSVAANALQNVCIRCYQHMTGYIPEVVAVAEDIDSFSLSSDAVIGLLKGAATILSKLPPSGMTDALRKLCRGQVVALEKLLSSPYKKVKRGTADDPSVWLDRLAAIFRNMNPSDVGEQCHPCQAVVVEIWPVLSQACEKYQADVRIMERCCRCIRFAIRCLGKSMGSLLNPLMLQMITLYQRHQHSCFLYLGSILVDEYGSLADCVPSLVNMLQEFCVPTFKVLEEQNGLRNHPDIVEDLFRLSLRFIQRAPVPFLASPLARPILCCAKVACSLDHKDTNAAVIKFLTELIKCGHVVQGRAGDEECQGHAAVDEECRALVSKLLLEQGQSLVMGLINASLFCLPAFMSMDISQVLYQLLLVDKQACSCWLEHSLQSLPLERSGVVAVSKEQLAGFHQALVNSTDLKQASLYVTDFCQLFR